jgi:predicted nuclease with TOPRIM domain
MNADEEVTVTYTVRELLQRVEERITAGFSKLEESLQAKADKGDIQRLAGRLDSHANRIEALEKRQDQDDTREQAQEQSVVVRRSMHERIYAALGALAGVALAVETYLMIRSSK